MANNGVIPSDPENLAPASGQNGQEWTLESGNVEPQSASTQPPSYHEMQPLVDALQSGHVVAEWRAEGNQITLFTCTTGLEGSLNGLGPQPPLVLLQPEQTPIEVVEGRGHQAIELEPISASVGNSPFSLDVVVNTPVSGAGIQAPLTRPENGIYRQQEATVTTHGQSAVVMTKEHQPETSTKRKRGMMENDGRAGKKTQTENKPKKYQLDPNDPDITPEEKHSRINATNAWKNRNTKKNEHMEMVKQLESYKQVLEKKNRVIKDYQTENAQLKRQLHEKQAVEDKLMHQLHEQHSQNNHLRAINRQAIATLEKANPADSSSQQG